MVDSLSLFCEMRGRLTEGMDLCWQAQMQVAADLPDALPLIWGRVFTHWMQLRLLSVEILVDAEMLQTKVEKSLELAQKQGEAAEIAFALWIVGLIALWTQNQPERLPL